MNVDSAILLAILLVTAISATLIMREALRIVDRLSKIIFNQNLLGTLIGEFIDVVKNLELDD